MEHPGNGNCNDCLLFSPLLTFEHNIQQSLNECTLVSLAQNHQQSLVIISFSSHLRHLIVSTPAID